MKPEELLQQIIEGVQGPLLVPVCVGVAIVLSVVLLLHSLSKPGKKKRNSKTQNVAGGTKINEEGLRRSTR